MAFRIYTKTGDKGTTALIGGKRVGKDHIRIEAYGTIDELNSHIGVVQSQLNDDLLINWIQEVQDRLFTIGSSLATDPDKDSKMKLPDLNDTDITFLEEKMDEMDEALPPLRAFVLPGGNAIAAQAHVARCVCRRAERICVHMQNNNEFVAEVIIIYLNRLSDFLFVLSRYILLKSGKADIEWKARI